MTEAHGAAGAADAPGNSLAIGFSAPFDGEEALTTLPPEQPDLVVSMLMLRKLDGSPVCRLSAEAESCVRSSF